MIDTLHTFHTGPSVEAGRTDVIRGVNDFIFTPDNESAFESIAIVDDDVLEFDELLIAEFEFGPAIANNWNVKKGNRSTTYIIIRDNDCELFNGNSTTQLF